MKTKKPTSKKKNYVVLVKAFTTICVLNAKDEEDALKVAEYSLCMGDLELDEMSVDEKINTPEELERAKYYAERIVDADDEYNS